MGTTPVLGQFDLGSREILNVILQKLTSDPGTPVEGQLFYRDDLDRPRFTLPSGVNKSIAFTDDVTSPANDSITNALLANMATATIKGRTTAGTGDPEDLTVAQTRTLLGLGSLALLSAVGSSEITDGSIVNGDINASAAIAFSKLQNVSATSRVLGRITAGAGAIEELTGANIRTILGTLDADTLNGSSAAAIASSAVNTITAGAGAAYDTLIEIGALLAADDTADAALVTTVAGKNAKGVAADLGTSSADAVHNHALGTRDVICQLVRKSDWKFVIAPFTITDTANVTWNLDAAPSAGQYRSIIIPAAA